MRADGIEPTRPAWKAGVLPLNYARVGAGQQLPPVCLSVKPAAPAQAPVQTVLQEVTEVTERSIATLLSPFRPVKPGSNRTVTARNGDTPQPCARRRDRDFGRVNIVLFEPEELGVPLPRSDRRVEHVLKVLRRNAGEPFDAGVVNGTRGKAEISAMTETTVTFAYHPSTVIPDAEPITVVVGLPRPQTARDILRDATTLGIAALHFVRTERGDASYAQSTLWSSGEWRRHAVAGAEQAFETTVPTVSCGKRLTDVLDAVCTADPHEAQIRIALDNYEAPLALSQIPFLTETNVLLAVGPERGWSNDEREMFRQRGFQLAHLGTRVLRTETAVLAAVTLARSKLGLM